MTKNQLIDAVAKRSGVSGEEAALIINTTLETISQTLDSGDKVQLTGFGTFEVTDRKARVGRNPHTKEAINIPATRVPTFKASKALKDRVAE